MKPSKLSFVVYEQGVSPRYYEIRKRLFRFLFFGLPTLALLSAIILAVVAIYFKQIRHMAKTKEPAIINELRESKRALEIKLQDIDKERLLLENKLAKGSSHSSQSLLPLTLFKPSPDRKDLAKSPEIGLEEAEVRALNKKIELNFKIINLTKPSRKVSGYIFVIMKHANQIVAWPNGVFGEKEMEIEYNKGELFGTTRFRPVKAIFPKSKGQNDALFKILIFNRIGDLVFRQILSKDFRTH